MNTFAALSEYPVVESVMRLSCIRPTFLCFQSISTKMDCGLKRASDCMLLLILTLHSASEIFQCNININHPREQILTLMILRKEINHTHK